MSADTPKCVADCQAVLGEGPVWVAAEQALYWLDIKGYRILRRSNEGAITAWETPFRICSLAPRAVGGFVAGTENGFALVDPAEDIYELIGDPEPERSTNRFNDGKVDREGRFWAGTMDDAEEQASGALYRLDQDRGWSRLDDGYEVTNGPAFSPDGRILYHNDSGRRTTFAFDVADDGSLANKRVFAHFEAADGYPDGMTVDAEGCLWIAFWDGWCVRRLSRDGEVLRVIELPVERPTSCAFGGPEVDQLFITSARVGLNAEALAAQPHAGGLFLARPGVAGIEERPFAG
ncbi:SMP-30/gluconolactonase/LRE family protein [Sphingosinicella sp. LY1275]|uniref:SMP-30/gluconolactonase/LRE family protein n=1 Tax=Sphingosinicella sp. LY1275 TaxID=3095379 RepID=UPI002ADEDFD5|nr:SMP-30/gluconolactonase/LRE family protein [Sphingosinicella sp. LY1275]MEA1015662.1 SMP-30/gluconolactonase/LRE family protein [Sphingosinicella sp. LY1275]